MERKRESRREVWIWVSVVAGAVVVVLLAVMGDRYLSDAIAAPAPPELPPSQRTSDRKPGEIDPEGYEILTCKFRGRALLDPPLPFDASHSGPHSMTLAPESSFSCLRPEGRSAGTVAMTATYPALGLYQGTGTGEGSISWTDLPQGSDQLGDGTTSTTSNELELAFPSITVWTSITDGPYTGFRGRLDLLDWELVQNEQGAITEVVFHPTEVTFSPE